MAVSSSLGFPDRLADGLTRAVIFGAGHGSTYPGKDSSSYVRAAIRAASQDDTGLVEHLDFDLGGPLFDGRPVASMVAWVKAVSSARDVTASPR